MKKSSANLLADAPTMQAGRFQHLPDFAANRTARALVMGIRSIALKGLRLGMQAVYAGMKLVIPQRDRVVFISRQSNAPSADFVLLADKIKELSPSTETAFSCRLGLKSEMGLSYIPLLLRQMTMLASARACVTESYTPPVSMLTHRRGVTVTQIWHSMVAIKKFGWQTVDTPEGSSAETARLMHMHQGYDHIIVGSEYMIPFFAEAMNTPAERIYPLGACHADILLQTGKGGTRAALDEKYPQIKGKRLIAYLPTMRRGEAVPCGELAQNFNAADAVLLIKPHPLDTDTAELLEGCMNGGNSTPPDCRTAYDCESDLNSTAAKCSDGTRAECERGGMSTDSLIIDLSTPTNDIICAADAVISDYSGTAADAAALDIPVYFYIPDIERYGERCGINFDPRDVFPAMSFANASALIDALSREADISIVSLEKELLAGGCNGNSRESIAQLVLYGRSVQK